MAWSDAARAAAAEARKFKSGGHVPGTRGGTRQQYAGMLRFARRQVLLKGKGFAARNAQARQMAKDTLKKHTRGEAKAIARDERLGRGG